jgi:hypothetical protein
MPCVKPIQAYQHIDGGALVFGAEPKNHRAIEISCGQCIGCRLTRSRHWATRIVHEAQCHDENVFITLTYNPENLPPDCGLRKKDFQDFMKRLRKAFPNNKIRYYHCGEYGDNTNRPHYHAILHGINFSDWCYLFDSPSGQPIYTSTTLEKIWSKGFVTIGEVTFESAAYVARYVVKKITGKGQDKIDERSGLILSLVKSLLSCQNIPQCLVAALLVMALIYVVLVISGLESSILTYTLKTSPLLEEIELHLRESTTNTCPK